MVIPRHNFSQRETTVVNILKNFDGEIKSFLNIGFHNWEDQRRHWWIKICQANNIDWKILAIYQPNVDDTLFKGCPLNNISIGNILDTESYSNYDCILFWHGPEHIDKKEFIKKLKKIEGKANKLIIFGMPLGHEPQDDVYGNIYEKHISDWCENDWTELGYTVIVVKDNRKYHHITTYKLL